jgi:D-3-phosphoglycerate dehydrogenase
MPDWVPRGMAEEGIYFVAYDCATRQDLAHHAADADVVWAFGDSPIMRAENLDVLERCGAIIRSGSGTDNVPVAEATQLGIVVANTPAAVSDAVADHAIALLLAVTRQIAAHDRALRQGKWKPNLPALRWQIQGQSLGLVGFGHIARAVAGKMGGFEMEVLVYDPYLEAEVAERHGVRKVDLDKLLTQSDFVSVHCPLAEDTHHLIAERELRLMKPGAILINTSRGAVLDESALLRALSEGWIGAAGLDVVDPEPPEPDNPLLQLENVVVTPHIGGYSEASMQNAWRLSLETAIDLAHGRWPRSVVNPYVKPRWNLH